MALTITPAVIDTIARIAGGPQGPTDLQRHLIAGIVSGEGHLVQERLVEAAVLGALTLSPIPHEAADRVAELAQRAGKGRELAEIVCRLANGGGAEDFEDLGWHGWKDDTETYLHVKIDQPWQFVHENEALADRWRALEFCPEGTLGREVWKLYTSRGFEFPGTPGSAPPLLTQHDFVHVLADYGTALDSELEVFAFVARTNPNPHGFWFLALVVSLFETGNIARGAGLFEANPGHLSSPGVAQRVLDAWRRGRAAVPCDLLKIDWLGLCKVPVVELRRRLNIVPKGPVGSPSAWGPGGTSPFQLAAGQAKAEKLGRPFEHWGATP